MIYYHQKLNQINDDHDDDKSLIIGPIIFYYLHVNQEGWSTKHPRYTRHN